MSTRNEITKQLHETLTQLDPRQLQLLQELAKGLTKTYQFILHASDLISDEILHHFGDALRLHHTFSDEPFAKEKFEHLFIKVFKETGNRAFKLTNTYPGADININEVPISLKTQANKDIKSGFIHISKFMELGTGLWGNDPHHLIGLRQQFLHHLAGYERIFVLRALKKEPQWHYELVEIPKTLLVESEKGTLSMSHKSKNKTAVPGFCRIYDKTGNLKFQLYFDGGSERKLQVQHINKTYCRVHAEWVFES